MPSSACPPWQTDKPARPAGERNDQPRSYTTSGDTILGGRKTNRKGRFRLARNLQSKQEWRNGTSRFLGGILVIIRGSEMNDKRITIRYVVAGMVGLAVLAYVLALVLGALPERAHIDFAAIVLVVVTAAGVALLFSPKWDARLFEALTRVRAFQFASLKVELEAIRARQDEQTSDSNSSSCLHHWSSQMPNKSTYLTCIIERQLDIKATMR